MQYYDVFEDLKKYPETTILIAYSRRGVGKTYGALLGALQRDMPISYIKRTDRDIDLLCRSTKSLDTSPYKPINRDHPEYNIWPKKCGDGLGAFYQMNDDNEPMGPAKSYCFSLNKIQDIKGFDISDTEFMIMDEFIPQATQRASRKECDALLDAHETACRDRVKRGKSAIPLLLFANAEGSIYCPIVDGLEIMDELAEMQMTGNNIKYIEDRGILIHHVNEIPLTEEETQTGLYKAMKGTAWWRKSFYGQFNVDFSNIEPKVLKQYKPLIRCIYREKDFYIYKKERDFYITRTPSNKYIHEFNLNRDNDVRLFYAKYCFALNEACMNGHVKFSSYDLYDLIIYFDKRFDRVL